MPLPGRDPGLFIDTPHQFRSGLRHEGGPPGQQFIENRSQRIKIARRRGRRRPVPGSFRGQIMRRAHGRPLLREGMTSAEGRPEPFGQAEITHIDGALLIENHIPRLDIPVQHPALVGKMHGFRHRYHQGRDLPPLSRQTGTPLRQSAPPGQFQGEPRQPIMFPGRIDRKNMGMVQGRHRGRFEAEPFLHALREGLHRQ